MAKPGGWTTGLCGCCEDMRTCCCGFFFPCILAAENIEIISDGTSGFATGFCLYYLLSIIGCQCCYTCGYRGRLRQKYFLPETPCIDFCVHCCCLQCALCQEGRELRNRGWDPSVGFSANQHIFAYRSQPGVQAMQR